MNGNVNSGAIGRLDGQATAILPSPYGQVYGTGLHFLVGGGYALNDRSELRGTFTFQSADADLVRLGDIGPSSLYAQYSDYQTFGLDAGYQTKIFSGLKIVVPDDFTWTVQFGGMTGKAANEAGLIFRDPPTVGSSFDGIWLRKNEIWQLYTWNGRPVANFAVRIVWRVIVVSGGMVSRR